MCCHNHIVHNVATRGLHVNNDRHHYPPKQRHSSTHSWTWL